MFDLQRDKFVRLDDNLDSRTSSPATIARNKCVFSIDGLGRTPAKSSFKMRMRRFSERLKAIAQSLRFGVSLDLKVIFDPHDKFIELLNKLFLMSCLLSVSIDPLLFYIPVLNSSSFCLHIDEKLAITLTALRTVIDAFYLIHMVLQFRTAYIAPSSRVFGRGELVMDPAKIAKRYLKFYFIIDFLAVFPLPQIVVWKFLRGSDVLASRHAILAIVLIQFVPRFARLMSLTSELKRTCGVLFAETAWAGALSNLLLFMLGGHIVGAFWYMLSVERNVTCWQRACKSYGTNCNTNFLYCRNQRMNGYDTWGRNSSSVLTSACPVGADVTKPPFNFGMFRQALSSDIVSSRSFLSKYMYCQCWGLQNLSTLGQGLQISPYIGESIFCTALAILGLILITLLIGNVQRYLQSLIIRQEEMRVKRRDTEKWMHHRLLPPDLRDRVRRYDKYKWMETRGVDEQSLLQTLPKDIRRDIKRHLCLDLVKRVPLFKKMDENLLDAICERLKPCLFTGNSYIVREGFPVEEMIFLIRGRLESVTTDGGRSGFYNCSALKEGDFCGEELLTWALDPESGSNLPSSTRTVKAQEEVEAFALTANELKYVASQFRRLHSREVQQTLRNNSQQWRSWAACIIQVAWRRYSKRKMMEMKKEE